VSAFIYIITLNNVCYEYLRPLKKHYSVIPIEEPESDNIYLSMRYRIPTPSAGQASLVWQGTGIGFSEILDLGKH
jgi:hypothetical protein